MEVSVSLKKAVDPQLARTLIAHLRQSTRTAAQVMTPEAATIAPRASISAAARLMNEKKVTRLPVIDDVGRLLGIISRLDILNVLAAGYLPQQVSRSPADGQTPEPETVAKVMDRAVPTVGPDTMLSEVLSKMSSTRAKRVVVIDATRRVVGIISDSDLLARMSPAAHPGILEQLVSRLPLGTLSAEARAHLQKARSKTASDLMTHDVVTLSAETPVGTALALSAEKHIKRFPVVDAKSELVGIVGRSALLSAMIREASEKNRVREDAHK